MNQCIVWAGVGRQEYLTVGQGAGVEVGVHIRHGGRLLGRPCTAVVVAVSKGKLMVGCALENDVAAGVWDSVVGAFASCRGPTPVDTGFAFERGCSG